MKILHIVPTYYPATFCGGPIFSVFGLNNALAQIPGVELKVLTTDTAGYRVSERVDVDAMDKSCFQNNQEVIFSKRIIGGNISVELLARLVPLVRWADVVHLTATFSFPTIPTLALCRLYNKPVVWSLRGALLDDQNRIFFDPQGAIKRCGKMLWLWLCGSFIQPGRVSIHVTTVQEEEASSKVYPIANYVIVPNGLNVPESLPVRNGWLPDGRLRVMFLGRLAPKKGIDNLLHAVEKVDTPISLAVYGASTVGQGGKNYGEHMVNLAKDLGILDTKVRFCGQVNGVAKNRAFLDADVCVIPSYSENFCIVVAEAMAMGLPVIVSDKLAWSEVAKRGCGLVVGNAPDLLAKALKEIRGMELETMGKLGWEWMKDEFRWKPIGFSMLSVYKKIITACESGN